MTAHPPVSSRPTGPPSGPLNEPAPGPPSGVTAPGPTVVGTQPRHGGPDVPAPGGPPDTPEGPGGTGGGGGGGGGGDGAGDDRPWWRSAPRIAILSAVVVAAVVVTVLLSRPDGGSGSGEVFLQPAAEEGQAPFTKSTAKKSSASASPTATPSTESDAQGGTAGVRGSAPGLYGGSRSEPSCDVEKQIDYLQREPAKADAFAGVQRIDSGKVPSYLRALTPVQLRMDTRVTNHGFENGKATAYQAVLQTGTAVLVDARGVPRVRCACGNPLTPPVAIQEKPRTVGKPWPAYRPSNTVVVQQSTTVVNVFVLVDPETGAWFKRLPGDTGGSDEPTTPPKDSSSASPDESPSQPSAPPSSPPPSTPSEGPSTPSEPSDPADPPTSEPAEPPADETGSASQELPPETPPGTPPATD